MRTNEPIRDGTVTLLKGLPAFWAVDGIQLHGKEGVVFATWDSLVQPGGDIP
jgi:hypothetical protein